MKSAEILYFKSSKNNCKHQADVLFADKPSLPSIGPGVTAASSGVMVGPDGNVESFIEDHKTRADNEIECYCNSQRIC